MAAPTNLTKRFRIPTLEEMENADSSNTEPGPSFKKYKETGLPLPQVSKSASVNTQGKEINNISRPPVNDQDRISHSSSDSLKHFRATVKQKQNHENGVLENKSETSAMALPTDGSKIPSTEITADIESRQVDSSNDGDEASKGTVITGSKPGSSNSLIVNTRQRGNPILKSVRNIPWEYGNIVPDYVMGQANCALFLSLRYHQLHSNYIHERLKQLGRSYDLRIMLVQVDVKEPHHLLRDLAKICLLADCTLILAFSPEEAGRYLETYKIFENKPAEAIMEKTEENFMAKFTDCMTRVKSVNKTDCATLVSHFGNVASVMEASDEDLSLCPGFGPQKAKRLHDIFHEPFLRTKAKGSVPKPATYEKG